MDNDIFPMSAAKAAENSQQDTLDTDESDFDIDIDVDEMIPGVAETSAQTGRPLPVDGSSPGSSSVAERPKATTLEVFEASADASLKRQAPSFSIEAPAPAPPADTAASAATAAAASPGSGSGAADPVASEVDIASLDMLEDLDSEVLDSASVPAPAPASAVALPGAAGLEAGKHSADDSDTAKGRSAAFPSSTPSAASLETVERAPKAPAAAAAPARPGGLLAAAAAVRAASAAAGTEWDDIANEAKEEPGDSDIEREWEEIAKRTEELQANARENRGVIVKQDLLSTPLSYKDVTQWLLQVDINREALREMQEETLGS
ncbi:unnamed protein product, partial [Effrenium voratum]